MGWSERHCKELDVGFVEMKLGAVPVMEEEFSVHGAVKSVRPIHTHHQIVEGLTVG